MTARRQAQDAEAGGGSGRLYNRIAVLRAERELSRYQLADAVGVNYQTIGYLERGEYNPSLELALRLAELFELPIEAIFSREPLRPMSKELYTPARDRALGSR
ncbi:MAG TPA: helix-turn-helix domain-containing protein [Candidatus Dormibacteraeota bacterium]|nr:helix-turn-helix domain-containing protein [Candidatus Dormibacteraeota bacterium]